MKLMYDSEVDALYIRLVEGQFECRTVQLSDEIALNIGPNELLVGIEILDARRMMRLNRLKPAVMLENIDLELAAVV